MDTQGGKGLAYWGCFALYMPIVVALTMIPVSVVIWLVLAAFGAVPFRLIELIVIWINVAIGACVLFLLGTIVVKVSGYK